MSTEKDTILINIMYTGDYTNKNIGHEIINLYKDDNGDNYIYISPYGRIDAKKFDKVETVLLARGAGTNCIQILAKAEIDKENSKIFKYEKPKYKKNSDEYKKLRNDFYTNVLGINNIIEFEKNNKKELAIKYLSQLEKDENLSNLDEEKIKQLEVFYIRKKLLNPTKEIKEECKPLNKIKIKKEFKGSNKLQKREVENIILHSFFENINSYNYNNYRDDISSDCLISKFNELYNKKNETDYILKEASKQFNLKKGTLRKLMQCQTDEDKVKYLDFLKASFENSKIFRNWMNYREHHNKQKEFLSNKSITYQDRSLDEIFSNNEGQETAAYITFKASEVVKPKNKILINYKEGVGRYEFDKEELKLSNIKLKNQSCCKYLKEEDFKDTNFKAFEEKLKKLFEENEATNTLNESKYQDDNRTFIDIMGKQYDELAYSNMFAYFFNSNPNLFKDFAKELSILQVADRQDYIFNDKQKTQLQDIKTDKIYEVKREDGHIDILIFTDNDVFIIENKIKSKIHGNKYDPYTETYVTNQLIEYYKYINRMNLENDKNEEEDNVKNGISSKNQHYLIFKPDYNDIDINKMLKITNEEDILKKYKVINYSDLLRIFKKIETNDLKNNIYYQEFKKAIQIHTEETDNIIEKEMEYKFRQAIEKAKPKSKQACPNLT